MNRIKLYNCLICRTACIHACCEGCLADLPYIPHHCLHCMRAVPLPHSACKPCQKRPSQLQFNIPLLYVPPISRIIASFKLSQQEDLCSPLVQLFLHRLSPHTTPDVLIPVPAHPRRLWERGYNPALLIARRLGKALGIPVDDRAISRIRHTPPQRLQTQQERRRNLKDAFETISLNSESHVALVDDVVTTGETLRALAEVVTPRVKSVVCWALAESPGR